MSPEVASGSNSACAFCSNGGEAGRQATHYSRSPVRYTAVDVSEQIGLRGIRAEVKRTEAG
jgi:hypothetical protein